MVLNSTLIVNQEFMEYKEKADWGQRKERDR